MSITDHRPGTTVPADAPVPMRRRAGLVAGAALALALIVGGGYAALHTDSTTLPAGSGATATASGAATAPSVEPAP